MQVMVVDMNVGFSQKGNLYSPRVGALVKPMAEFLSKLPLGNRVVFLSDRHNSHDPELSRFPNHCMRGSGEELINGKLLLACSNINYELFYKNEHDVFVDTNEDRIIHPDSDDNNWIVIGCVTDICIEAAVGSLVMREQNVTVIRNLIDTFDAPGHDAEEINKFWFDQRFPNIWGAKVVEDWKELV